MQLHCSAARRCRLRSSTNLSVSYHGAGDLLGPSDLPRAQGAFGCEVKAQAVGGDQGAPLIGLPQDASQGKVQDVRCRVVAHDWPTTTLGIGNASFIASSSTQFLKIFSLGGSPTGSHLVNVQSNLVSDSQRSVDCPHVQDVASSDLRVLDRELHSLRW